MEVNANPYRDSQEEEAVAYCENKSCKQEIYPGGCRYLWEGNWYCVDCLRAAVERELRECPEQVALEMGLDVERH